MTSTTTTTVRFSLETSAGTRESCWLCRELVDKMEVAASAQRGDIVAGPICLRCLAGGEAAMRAQFAKSLADHRAELGWLRAQATLDRTIFEAQVSRALRQAAELEDHIAADEAFVAATWEVPDREAIADYLAEDYWYWRSADPRPAERDAAWDAAEARDAAEAIERIRNLTGVTVSL